jgi:hypothetical protein
MAVRHYNCSLGAACECDLASLVRHDPARFPVLRAFCSAAVRDWLPMALRDAASVVLYHLAHPYGWLGRVLRRRMPGGPTKDPWGKSYLPPGQRGYDALPAVVSTRAHEIFCRPCYDSGTMVRITDPYMPCPRCGFGFGFPCGCPWPREER